MWWPWRRPCRSRARDPPAHVGARLPGQALPGPWHILGIVREVPNKAFCFFLYSHEAGKSNNGYVVLAGLAGGSEGWAAERGAIASACAAAARGREREPNPA